MSGLGLCYGNDGLTRGRTQHVRSTHDAHDRARARSSVVFKLWEPLQQELAYVTNDDLRTRLRKGFLGVRRRVFSSLSPGPGSINLRRSLV